MPAIYEKPDHIVVSHNQKLNYVLFDWRNFYVTPEEIQELHRAALAYARPRRCVYYIANTSNVQNALRQDVVQWWGDEWVPTLADYGLKAIFTIVPKAALAKFSTKRWQSPVLQNGIDLVDVPSLVRAELEIRTRENIAS